MKDMKSRAQMSALDALMQLSDQALLQALQDEGPEAAAIGKKKMVPGGEEPLEQPKKKLPQTPPRPMK